MKSEHRHELQTNELSAGLALWIERVKPYVGQIVTGVVALVVVYAGLTIWKAQAAERDHAAWDAYAYASDSSKPGKEDLLNAAQNEDFDGSTMQEWAYITWADGQVAQAIETYCYEREITNKALENASGVYNNLIEGASDQRVLNRARFGMARVYEMQNKIDQASELYLQVRGDLQLRSSDRAEQLESEEVREACEWLATIELPKPDLTGGQGASGIRPDFDAALPGFDGINLEDLKKALDESTAKETTEDKTEEKTEEKKEATSTEASTEEADAPSEETAAVKETTSEETATEETATEEAAPAEEAATTETVTEAADQE